MDLRIPAAAIAITLLIAGCDGGSGAPDASTASEAGIDAQAIDASPPIDADPSLDAQTPIDAPAVDAGPVCDDADGDGSGSIACGGTDCDDGDPDRFPGNDEVCDPIDHDEDCDPTTFGVRDRDGDGHVDATCCNLAPDGTTSCGDDCDDLALGVRPGAAEICNGVDDDCDGTVDDGVLRTYHRDADRDGFGCTCSDVVTGCAAPTGYVEESSDCDDTLTAFHPGANGTCGLCPAPYRRLEICDGLDDDCSGIVDDGTATAGCAVPHGTATCSAGACTFVSCDAGYHACGGSCEPNASIATCGASCTPCAPPAHATATCDGTSCGFVCIAGTVLVGGACDPRPPRPIAPLSTATVTSARPTLRWSLVPGTDGARVEICRDRACATVVTTFDATGTSGAPAIDLPAGVLFWRLRGRIGADVGAAVSVTWQLTVGARSAPVDSSYGTTLDVNGDGYADLAVGAWGDTADGITDPGVVRVYHGGAGGLGATSTSALVGPDGAEGAFGISVASAGDVNGDGYADLVVGASGVNFDAGRAYLYLGGPSGVATPAARRLVGPDTMNASFGCSVASAGDVNRDGYADVVIGANGAGGTGRAYVHLGGAGGLSATAATILVGPDGLNGDFGWSVAGAVDVDGDGDSDVVVGAPNVGSGTGRVHVYLGSASGLATVSSARFDGPVASGRFGTSVAIAGDVNGDGYADVVVGAPRPGTDAGRAHVFLGNATGLGTAAGMTIVGPDGAGGSFGEAVDGAGDVNGDGYSDLVVGAPTVSSSTGRAHVYLGGIGGVGGTPPTTLVVAVTGGRFGASVSGLGDVNGDGWGDVAVGAPRAASGRGQLRLYLGAASGLGTTAARTDSGGPFLTPYYGTSIAAAGDTARAPRCGAACPRNARA